MDNKILAKVYYKLLLSIDWTDELLVKGLREGLNKFLSNTFLAGQARKNKYHKSHYVSLRALEKLKAQDYSRLIYEHIIPKTKYIQVPCEELAISGSLTEEFIKEKLDLYWKLATVTKEEDQKLEVFSMPKDWDGKNVFARYATAGIDLVDNPFFS